MIFSKEPIELLRLPTRTMNAFLAQGIETIDELSKYSINELIIMDNVGLVGIAQIKKAYAQRGVDITSVNTPIQEQGIKNCS